MTTTSISKLKSSLSLFLNIIKKGEEVIITDRGKAFAKIIPLENNESTIPASLLDLERAGLAYIGTGTLPDDFWTIKRPYVKDNMGIKVVLDERVESR